VKTGSVQKPFQRRASASRALGGDTPNKKSKVQWAWTPISLIIAGGPIATAWSNSRLPPDQHSATFIRANLN